MVPNRALMQCELVRPVPEHPAESLQNRQRDVSGLRGWRSGYTSPRYRESQTQGLTAHTGALDYFTDSHAVTVDLAPRGQIKCGVSGPQFALGCSSAHRS